LAQSHQLLLKQQHAHFKTAVAVSLALVLAVILFLVCFGKVGAFIVINNAYNPPLDYFFQYVTLLGDGLIYIPIVIYSIFFNRKFLVPLIASIIICTIITHFLKRVVFPGELRPFSLELQKIIIHKVEGVPLHRQHSFPSGHTSTAFTTALLLASVMRRAIWAYILPLIAFGVGYSRIYLAQHFPTDVCAGMLIGIVSAYLSLLIYEAWLRKRSQAPGQRQLKM
jgi:membrane-associated phospholipid phosphatase